MLILTFQKDLVCPFVCSFVCPLQTRLTWPKSLVSIVPQGSLVFFISSTSFKRFTFYSGPRSLDVLVVIGQPAPSPICASEEPEREIRGGRQILKSVRFPSNPIILHSTFRISSFCVFHHFPKFGFQILNHFSLSIVRGEIGSKISQNAGRKGK